MEDVSSKRAVQAFMAGYVQRINESTLNVPVGGVRIGSAKYSRLAQINLNTRIITFSKYAIENVPERGRRYLVIHELTHVVEPGHNKRFWSLVAKYEPDYRRIDKELEQAFRLNVRQEYFKEVRQGDSGLLYPQDKGIVPQEILEYEDRDWELPTNCGIICGGFASETELDINYLDHVDTEVQFY